MNSLPLRSYQREDIDRVYAAWRGDVRPTGAGLVNRVAVVAATGLGKTVEFASMISEHIAPQFDIGQSGPRLSGVRHTSRALVLVHRDELAQQARAKIRSVAPHLRCGIVMAGRHEPDAQVIIGSVPTLGRADGKRASDIRGVGLVVVDEAHHAAAPTWRRVLERFGAFAGVPTVGYSATLTREDGLGLGEVFQEVVSVRDTPWGIRNGWLAPVRGIRVQVPSLDLGGIRMRAGDLDEKQVAQAMLNADTGGAIVKAIQEYGSQQQGVVFAPDVATAMDFAEHLTAAGIANGIILGTTKSQDRAEIYKRFREGDIQYLVNAMVLTEGWDAPWAKVCVVARPTKSNGLYQQMIGRVLRPWNGETALVLDMVGATETHGLASLVDLDPDAPQADAKPRGQNSDPEWEDTEDLVFDQFDQATGFTFRPVETIHGTEIDLLSQSHTLWLQTKKGTWFIPAADDLFFLWPQPDGQYMLGVTPIDKAERATPLMTDLTFEIGMAWAEKYAKEAGGYNDKKASWRNRGSATDAQKRKLQGWGYNWFDVQAMTSAQASDAISIHKASLRLDR